MGTCFTEGIKDNISFEDFAMDCTRAFIYAYRDLPGNCKLLEKIEPDIDYYVGKLKETEKNIEYYTNISDDDLQKEIDERYNRKKKTNTEYNIKQKENQIKFKNMLKKVKEWQPPTEKHINLKKFMIEQIEKSFEYLDDLNEDLEKENRSIDIIEYRKEKLDNLKDDLQDSKDEIQKELDYVESTNLWLKQLKESLGIEKNK